MLEYLNTDCCDFNNDASASSFGWNFQSNAGIFLFLKFIRESDSIKIESRLQDIEITLHNGSKILAQAKSAQDYSITKDKKEKFKDALISMAKHSDEEAKFVYISNIPDTLITAKDAFNNKIVSYASCINATKDEIDKIFESIIQSVEAKITKEKDANKKRKIKQLLRSIESFDKSKLFMSVIYPYYGDGENRYTIIGDSIISFLIDQIKLGRDDAIAIKQKLLNHWQLTFQHNSTQPDKIIEKKITKEEFAWPVAVFLIEDTVPDIDECLSFVPDDALRQEISRYMSLPSMIYHERFEFMNKVIQAYLEYKKSLPIGTKDAEKEFIKNQGENFYTEFKIDDDMEKTEYLTKSLIFKILINHRNMGKIRAGIGVKK